MSATIEIVYREPEEVAAKKKSVSIIRLFGIWAVHLNIFPGPRFVITHVPTGAVAWPKDLVNATTSLPEALRVAAKLQELWDRPGVFPREVQLGIAKLVGEDSSAEVISPSVLRKAFGS